MSAFDAEGLSRCHPHPDLLPSPSCADFVRMQRAMTGKTAGTRVVERDAGGNVINEYTVPRSVPPAPMYGGARTAAPTVAPMSNVQRDRERRINEEMRKQHEAYSHNRTPTPQTQQRQQQQQQPPPPSATLESHAAAQRALSMNTLAVAQTRSPFAAALAGAQGGAGYAASTHQALGHGGHEPTGLDYQLAMQQSHALLAAQHQSRQQQQHAQAQADLQYQLLQQQALAHGGLALGPPDPAFAQMQMQMQMQAEWQQLQPQAAVQHPAFHHVAWAGPFNPALVAQTQQEHVTGGSSSGQGRPQAPSPANVLAHELQGAHLNNGSGSRSHGTGHHYTVLD